MVGHLPLEQVIMVRVHVSQPQWIARRSCLTASLLGIEIYEDLPVIFE